MLSKIRGTVMLPMVVFDEFARSYFSTPFTGD